MLNEGTTIVMDRYAYSGVAYSAAKVKIRRIAIYFILNIHIGIIFRLVQESGSRSP